MAYSTITKPSLHFNTVLYTSNNGTSPRTISGVGFQPDFVWVKNRDSASYNHVLNDSVRGLNKILSSDTNGAELAANHAGGYISSANNDGFVITAGSSNLSNYDTGTNKQVVWNWKANGAGSSNSDGSITSTVSANTTAGFSIVTVANIGSGDFTFGHGLGVAPSWVLAKSRDGGKWNNYFKSLGAGYTIQLPETSGKISNTTMWQNTAPTSSVVYSNGNQLDSNESYLFYCFAEKTGYSKFGKYTGNGNANGTFVYTGFKPAWIMVKRTSASGDNWIMFDNKRDEFNVTERKLEANDSGAEVINTSHKVDFLSNGFKMKATGVGSNGSGSTYIYMAFAEEPLVANVGNSIPATAR